jgi:nucleotide-binding universal stress UspA family protein
MSDGPVTSSGQATGSTGAPQLVLGWDRQPGSAAALEFAIGIARRLRAHLHVVHVADTHDFPIDPDAFDWEEQLSQRLIDDETAARSVLGRLDTAWSYHAAHGRPSEVIANLAEETNALMIVVGGPRGGMHSFIETIAGQSVSRQLTRRHGRPVLIVPEP